ncbi:MAG: TetR/AcrR family transcriptional regulator [Actinocrinis sp.]
MPAKEPLTASQPVIWLRPAASTVGRPAERSRDQITAAALDLADREGLDAVSMRRVAAGLGTGAASLYRYVANRDDLLDLMVDATAAEYDLPPLTGDWTAGLLAIAGQARGIMLRHPWLPELVVKRPALGPHAVDVLEYALGALSAHPAAPSRKLEAFALLNALVAAAAQTELSVTRPAAARQVEYLTHVAAAGTHPRIAELFAAASGPNAQEPAAAGTPFETILTRVLTGLLDG